jgi:hypothetical protein
VFAGHEHRYLGETFNGNKYFRVGTTAAIPRDNIPECERQFLIVDFRGTTPKVQVVKVEENV